MRFNVLKPGAQTPSFSQKDNRYRFLSIAAAEIVLLTLVVLLFLKLKALFDQTLLISVMLLLVGILTYFFIKSTAIAHSVLFLSMISLEVLLLLDLPPYHIPIFTVRLASTDLMLAMFLATDVFMLWWILNRGLGVAADKRIQEARELHSPYFYERINK